LAGLFVFWKGRESLLYRTWMKIKNSEANDLILTSGENGIIEIIPPFPLINAKSPAMRDFLVLRSVNSFL
jgi:hypothetical protein